MPTWCVAGLHDYVDCMFHFCRGMGKLAVDNAEYALLTALTILAGQTILCVFCHACRDTVRLLHRNYNLCKFCWLDKKIQIETVDLELVHAVAISSCHGAILWMKSVY